MSSNFPDPWNVVITGVGGQGNVLASQILGQALMQKGYIVTIGETYGASQRGGSVMSHLRVSPTGQWSPLIPEGQAHMVVGLEPMETLRVMAQYGNPEVIALTNTRPISPLDVVVGNATYPDLSHLEEQIKKLSRRVWTINATEIALEMGNSILSNMIMLGAIASLGLETLPLSRENFLETLQVMLPAKMIQMNMEAFDRGAESVVEC